ncbi:DNRLRE domain-containing protein [Nocardioides sp. InS609-2]|uniref:DNRLRE domain-containing protein n=1 Tax=Nocardioides sp. InS609-2 TaxID=2760705 RepID=UPI0020BD6DA6|nr:DNRLRE domain-containing protein [Nocardioides sp. InS609-2]
MHYEEAGKWKAISPELVPAEADGYAWRNEANSFGAEFKKTLDPEYLRFSVEGKVFSFTALGAAAVAATGQAKRPAAGSQAATETAPSKASSSSPSAPAESDAAQDSVSDEAPVTSEASESPTADSEVPDEEPSSAPDPAGAGAGEAPDTSAEAAVAGGTVIEYRSAFPGASMRYDVTPTGVKETIVLEDARAPVRYRFLIDQARGQGGQVSVQELSDGSWAFTEQGAAEPLFVMEPPYVVEGSTDRLAGEPSREPVSMKVSEVGRGFAVDMDVDAAWLQSPERSFPIQIDPTLTVQPTSEDATFGVGGGSFLSDGLYIGADNGTVWRSALLFDLAGVPSDATVTNAELGLHYNSTCMVAATICHNDSTARQIDVHTMTSAWSTSSTTSQLGFTAAPAASFSLLGTTWPQWMKWDVTPEVDAWLRGGSPNYGFLVKKLNETLGSGGPVPPGRRSSEPSFMPKLEVTYLSDAVDLRVPETLHSDGADLAWSRFTSVSGAAFDRYEVHRGATAGFSPSSSTLLATIRDIDRTGFRDTTAAPNRTFVYKVVANSSVSNPQTVTLPADGFASKVLQPDAAQGQGTQISYFPGITNCANYGAADGLLAGTMVSGSQNSVWRSLLTFDLSDIPQGAAIGDATLSLFQQYNTGAGTVDVHRVTRAWHEGTGGAGNTAQCTDNGATWYVSDGTTPWSTQGGDIATEPAASKVPSAGGRDDFGIRDLVQGWANGSSPNFGMAIKTRTETLGAESRVSYHSDDMTVSPSLRPRLAVSYADGSHAQGPSASIVAPAAGDIVSGTVAVTASAADDRRVESVQLKVDNTVVSTDTTAPFAWNWNSASVANGSRELRLVATDDAGNTTTSAPASVTVRNSAAPTVSLTAPAASATVTGTVTISANAGDDVAVDRVEFFVDGTQVGAADTTAPYSVAWNTLDPAAPFYDGSHEVTARAWDGDQQVTVSAARPVTVANTAGTLYKGTVTSTAVPSTMVYDPAGGTAQPTYGLQVTAANSSTGTWSASDIVARYRWVTMDGVVVSTGPDATFGADIRKDRSGVATVVVRPPTLDAGVDRAQHVLRVDLYQRSTGKYFSAAGLAPLDNPVIVNKAIQAAALGLEEFYQYEAEPVGAGMEALTNVSSGNSLINWTPWASPGRGLATVLGLTYNSLEDHSDSPVGNNFSLAISSLTRFGVPLDIHPNKADEIVGNTKAYIEFTDGDGTTHRFTRNAAGGWDEPAGVHLYLRKFSTTDTTRTWALTRPDNVTFFYDASGFPTFIKDQNGNQLKFTMEDIPAGQDPGNVKRRVTAVTDAAGLDATPAPDRSFKIAYYSKDDSPKAQVRGKIKTITDHNNSVLAFDYYDDGNLRRITQRGGTNTAAGGFSAQDRSWTFTYTTSDGSGPAIASATDRVNPNAKTPNQSTRLFSVADPLNRETRFTYYGPTSGQLRWKLASRTNRADETTSYSYDLTARTTTSTAPLSRAMRYGYDTSGQVTAITNPLNQTTALAWNSDRLLTKITEPTGVFTEYAYNANGYLTETWDQLRNRTTLTYQNLPVDGVDTSSTWRAGRTIAHLSRLATKTSPRGTKTSTPTDDFRWDFGYDTAGNLNSVTEPPGSQPAGDPRYTTTHTYRSDGTVATSTDQRNNTTQYQVYDANGLPTQVTDAAGFVAKFGYDADGNPTWSQDPRHAAASGGDPQSYRQYAYYDEFGRLRRTSAPKSTSTNASLVWTATDYDANDNPTVNRDAEYGYQFVAGPLTTATFDAMDRMKSVTNPDNETSLNTYDTAGRLTSTTSPEGVRTTADPLDRTVLYDYDLLDRVTRETQHNTSVTPAVVQRTHYCYDLAGDLVSVTAPNANIADVNCATPPSHTTTVDYDDAHRTTATTDPLGHRTSRTYDDDGNTETLTDPDNRTTTTNYDPRGLATKTVEPLTATRNVTTLMSYDAAGNLARVVSPRGWDASTDKQTFTQFVTDYTYDPIGRLTRTSLPTATGETRSYVHRDYDANSNLTTTTLPDPAEALSGVPMSRRTDLCVSSRSLAPAGGVNVGPPCVSWRGGGCSCWCVVGRTGCLSRGCGR